MTHSISKNTITCGKSPRKKTSIVSGGLAPGDQVLKQNNNNRQNRDKYQNNSLGSSSSSSGNLLLKKFIFSCKVQFLNQQCFVDCLLKEVNNPVREYTANCYPNVVDF